MMPYKRRFAMIIIVAALSQIMLPQDAAHAVNDRILRIGDIASGQIPDGSDNLSYVLETEQHTLITLRFQALDIEARLYDSGGYHIIPMDAVEGAMGFVQGYHLSGQPPYRLDLIGSGDYRIHVLEGDHVTRHCGELWPGQRVYGRPRGDGTRFVHDLDVPADGLFTLTVTPDDLSLPDMHIVDESGQDYQPILQNISHEHLSLVYQLPPDGLYQAWLQGTGPYEIDMLAGDAITIPGADLSFDQAIQAEVPSGRMVSHLLPGSQDDTLTVYNVATSDADQINWEIFNPDVFDATGQYVLPYRMTGAARMGHGEAIVLELEEAGRYFMRMINIANNPDQTTGYLLAAAPGDVIRLDGGSIAPGQQVTIQNDTIGLRVSFTLDAETGDSINVRGDALVEPVPPNVVHTGDGTSFRVAGDSDTYHLIVDVQEPGDYTLSITSDTAPTITEQRRISTDGYGLSAFEDLLIKP